MLGLLAAFATGVLIMVAFFGVQHATGCVEAITVRPGLTSCPATLEGSFMWLTLKDWVNEGALLALVTVPVAAYLSSVRRRRRRPIASTMPTQTPEAVAS
jgi:hypothetical protein